MQDHRIRRNTERNLGLAFALAVVMALPAPALARRHAPPAFSFTPRSLDGSGNNPRHPSWGTAGTPYQRLAPANYGDGVSTIAGGPNARYISNRIFNASGVDLFSERNLSQWAWVWGQFLDHTFGLAQGGNETSPITTSATDPLVIQAFAPFNT